MNEKELNRIAFHRIASGANKQQKRPTGHRSVDRRSPRRRREKGGGSPEVRPLSNVANARRRHTATQMGRQSLSRETRPHLPWWGGKPTTNSILGDDGAWHFDTRATPSPQQIDSPPHMVERGRRCPTRERERQSAHGARIDRWGEARFQLGGHEGVILAPVATPNRRPRPHAMPTMCRRPRLGPFAHKSP